MTVAVQCTGCNSRLNAPPSAAGRKVKCPRCATVLAVPAAEDYEIVEEEFEVVENPPVKAKPAKRLDDEDDDDEDRRSRTVKCPECGEKNDPDERRCECGASLKQAKPKKKKVPASGGFWHFERNLMSGGALGGILAMIGAAV